jgi:hypothetical protein
MTTSNEPGWREDPNDPKALRYWDGQEWTPHRQRKPTPTPAPAPLPPAPPPPSYPPPSALPPPPSFPPPSALPPPPQWPPPGVGPPRRSRTPVVVTAVIVAVLAVAGVVVYKFVYPGTPEDQIKAATQTFADDLNNANSVGLAAVLCAQVDNATTVKSADELRQQRDEKGTVSVSVTAIHVTGDRATATLTASWTKSAADSGSDTMNFSKENGDWKVCPAPDRNHDGIG